MPDVAPPSAADAGLAAEPEGLLAARLGEMALAAGADGVIHLARSETRAERIARAAQALAPGLLVAQLPAWDCLPYDRAAASPEIMGARMAALHALDRRDGAPCLLVVSAAAAVQRVPPPDAWRALRLRRDGPLDPDALGPSLLRLGYREEDTVDAPGQMAIRGEVVDVFPPGAALACRIDHRDGRVAAIRLYDPLSQRSEEQAESVLLPPASELVLAEAAPPERPAGAEHALAEYHAALRSVFELLPGIVVLDPEAGEQARQQIAEAHEAFRARLATGGAVPEPARMYLDAASWDEAVSGRTTTELAEPADPPPGALPRFRDHDDPEAALVAFVRKRLDAGARVGLSMPPRHRLARLLERRLGTAPLAVDGWTALRATPPGRLALLPDGVQAGFDTPEAAVVAPGDAGSVRSRTPSGRTALPADDAALRIGDAVIHEDHGVGALRGIETIEAAEAPTDCLRLEYAGGASLLVPADEIDRLWRYGAEADAVTLDHLNGEAWAKRRQEVAAQLVETAREMVRLAQARDAASAPALVSPRRAYERFAARFPYLPTEDQARAIDAVLADLASGHPMDRLVCGDVGFGKTEVALRAAAAAVLSGRQVAVLAPTTVLVRQHLGTFRRRFAGFDVAVEPLSRLSSPAKARAVKAGLADGGVRIAIGTQALAGRGIRFKDLALLIVDEEQRFGARQKSMLRQLGRGVHVLTLTATPIPRTLQSALVGLQDLSVIATPPARRQPIRTIAAPVDPVLIRGALERERRRGGQSFVVCPRIEDLPDVRRLLSEILPELSVLEAHGKMPAAEADEAMVRFAEGGADALLSTNIVEAGLDVPRANTMIVWGADRFGLAQLHQLRGRVGRGRVRGAVYLLTKVKAAGVKAAEAKAGGDTAAQKRLRTLESLNRLGAGFTISARDMDLRGAGDLMGDAQAGHVRLIGLELYQHLLDRALCLARGEMPPEEWTPALALGLPAFIPEEYVPEPDLRVGLLARLGQMPRRDAAREAEELSEELADRFGPPPEPVRALLAAARLRARCRALGIARLEVGPQAAAATPHGPAPETVARPLEKRGERIILRRESATAADRLEAATALLDGLAARTGPTRAADRTC